MVCEGNAVSPVDAQRTVACKYARAGQIVARTANGVRQTYEYDKKGQLLAVKDAEGNAVERYAYDKAGNMLKKTVGGKTTTFTFDEANQLVSSTTDGVTIFYAYDAAGRLVTEGNKTYRYGYLDKVLSVTDGDTTRTFTYHADGQLATANNERADANRSTVGRGDPTAPQSETFLWDGLALVRRNDEQFINEPHVGGGNPVVSSKGVSYFNDMLGTTVGAKKDGKYSAAALSAFGENLSVHSPTPTQNSNFFTGKPYVEGLGRTFLMRNYRAGLAKWQTADPMGYPDGWNQLAYCGNGVTSAVDLWGCARVNHSLTIGGTPNNPNYGGETTYLINIANILESTHTIVLNVDISIAYSSLLYASSAYKSGTVVTYDPHKGDAGGAISENVREAVEAHETGHANYVIDVIVPILESRMKMLEVKWFVQGWSEAKVRDEIILAISQLNLNVKRDFLEAANDSTVAWFNSSPDWKLVHDAHSDGKWKWVKE